MKQTNLLPRLCSLAIAALLLLGPLYAAASRSPEPVRAAAGSTQVFLPLLGNPVSFSQSPRPVSLPVRLDSGRRTSAIVPAQPAQAQNALASDYLPDTTTASSTVITATAVDGALFTLEIPHGALLTDTQILMTPINAIGGQLLGGSAGAAVQLEPDGLQFLLPVTLTIQTSASIPVTSELTLSWHGDGQEFHRYPLLLERPYPQVAFRAMHFSGYAYLGDNISIPIDDGSMPSDPEDQFKQAWEELIRREREAQAAGQPGNPNFHQDLMDLLRAYYEAFVRPIMQAAEGDCDYAESGVISKATGWAREAEMLRSEGELETELQEYHDSYIRILENCWRERTQPCINRSDLNQWREVLTVARQGQLMGLDFDPSSVPECECSGFASIPAWELTYNMSFSRDVEGGDDYSYKVVSVDHQQSGSILLDYQNDIWPPFPGWVSSTGSADNMPTGSASVNDTSTTYLYDGRQFHDSTIGSGVTGGFAYLTIDETNCTYSLEMDVTTHVVDDSFQKEPEEHNLIALSLYLIERNAYSADPTTTVLSGEGDFQVDTGGGIYSEVLVIGDGYATHHLFNLLYPNAGYGHASWMLTPLP